MRHIFGAVRMIKGIHPDSQNNDVIDDVGP